MAGSWQVHGSNLPWVFWLVYAAKKLHGRYGSFFGNFNKENAENIGV
jgi:hypothetical protein